MGLSKIGLLKEEDDKNAIFASDLVFKGEILEDFTNNQWWLKTNCCSIRSSSKIKEGF
jgi:hypothetical protein